jgi:hypothetical protein
MGVFFMKNVKRKILLMAFLICSAAWAAEMPQPVISVGFGDLWAQVNTTGGTVYQQGSVFSYDDGGTIIEPVLTSDDLFSYTYQQNGAVGAFGGGITYQGPELASAISGLDVFTIVCVFSPQSYGHEGASILFSAENTSGGHSIALLVDQWNRLALCVNDQWEQPPAYIFDEEQLEVERHPACWDANVDKWSFAAITYDGNIDPQTADPWAEEDQNVRHYIAQNATTGTSISVNKGAIDALNHPCLYAGSVLDAAKLWISNCADTSMRLVIGEEGGFFVDDSHSAAFPGKVKNLLIYDEILTEEQIAAVRASLTTAGCGGVGNPYPKGDINFDCKVDGLDIQLFAENWLSSVGVVGW